MVYKLLQNTIILLKNYKNKKLNKKKAAYPEDKQP
jgi:hypothetical protein